MKTLEPIIMQKHIEIGVQLIVLWQPVHYILTDLLDIKTTIKRGWKISGHKTLFFSNNQVSGESDLFGGSDYSDDSPETWLSLSSPSTFLL